MCPHRFRLQCDEVLECEIHYWHGRGELNKQAVCDSSTTKLYKMQISLMQMWVVRVSFSRVIYKSVGICTFAETTIPVA